MHYYKTYIENGEEVTVPLIINRYLEQIYEMTTHAISYIEKNTK